MRGPTPSKRGRARGPPSHSPPPPSEVARIDELKRLRITTRGGGRFTGLPLRSSRARRVPTCAPRPMPVTLRNLRVRELAEWDYRNQRQTSYRHDRIIARAILKASRPREFEILRLGEGASPTHAEIERFSHEIVRFSTTAGNQRAGPVIRSQPCKARRTGDLGQAAVTLAVASRPGARSALQRGRCGRVWPSDRTDAAAVRIGSPTAAAIARTRRASHDYKLCSRGAAESRKQYKTSSRASRPRRVQRPTLRGTSASIAAVQC